MPASPAPGSRPRAGSPGAHRPATQRRVAAHPARGLNHIDCVMPAHAAGRQPGARPASQHRRKARRKEEAMTTTDTMAMRPLLFPDDQQFWYETLRALGHTAYGGADIGEVVTTAQRITANDYDSWYEQWAATAQRVEAEARGQLAAGHQVSGHDGLLRAATYWRSAEFFTRDADPDPRGRAAYEASVRCFVGAAALMSPAVTPVTIPFEGTALNGYLYQPPGGGPAATCVMHGGFDSTAEEWHHIGALAAQQRGYTVITFDGPGQPGPHYRDGLVFRPNWESVVSPVTDWAAERPEVDPARIALFGLSMGGGLAPGRRPSSRGSPR